MPATFNSRTPVVNYNHSAGGGQPGRYSQVPTREVVGYVQPRAVTPRGGPPPTPAAPEPAPAPAPAPAPTPPPAPEPTRDLTPARTSFQKAGSYLPDSQATADDRRTGITLPSFRPNISQSVVAPGVPNDSRPPGSENHWGAPPTISGSSSSSSSNSSSGAPGGGYLARALQSAADISGSGLGSFGGSTNSANTARTRDQSYGGHWRQDRADRQRMAGDASREIERQTLELRRPAL